MSAKKGLDGNLAAKGARRILKSATEGEAIAAASVILWLRAQATRMEYEQLSRLPKP